MLRGLKRNYNDFDLYLFVLYADTAHNTVYLLCNDYGAL